MNFMVSIIATFAFTVRSSGHSCDNNEIDTSERGQHAAWIFVNSASLE